MPRLGCHCVLAALIALTAVALHAADDAVPFTLSDWKVQVKPAADGTQPRTFVACQLTYTGDGALTTVTVTADLRDPATGAAQSSDRKTFTHLAANQAQTLMLSIPAANDKAEYRLTLQYPVGGRTRQAILGGGTATDVPTLGGSLPATPASDKAGDPKTLGPGNWRAERIPNTKNAKLTATVINDTDAAITDPVYNITLTFAAKGKDTVIVHQASIKVAGTLAAGATQQVEKIIPDCPEFNGIRVEAVVAEGPITRSPGLGEPKPDSKGEWEEGMEGGKQVEVGVRKIALNAKGEIEVLGKVRNGYATAVVMQSIEWEFTTPGGTVKKTQTDLRGKLPPNTLSAVNLTIPNIGDFTRYNYTINYRE